MYRVLYVYSYVSLQMDFVVETTFQYTLTHFGVVSVVQLFFGELWEVFCGCVWLLIWFWFEALDDLTVLEGIIFQKDVQGFYMKIFTTWFKK